MIVQLKQCCKKQWSKKQRNYDELKWKPSQKNFMQHFTYHCQLQQLLSEYCIKFYHRSEKKVFWRQWCNQTLDKVRNKRNYELFLSTWRILAHTRRLNSWQLLKQAPMIWISIYLAIDHFCYKITHFYWHH